MMAKISSTFEKNIVCGVSGHLKCELDRVQHDVNMFRQYIDTFVVTNQETAASLEFAEGILENSRTELAMIGLNYKTPYAYTISYLSKLQVLMQHNTVTYEMVSNVASSIFILMQMSLIPWVRGIERPRLCRWLWDHWSEIKIPNDTASTWVVVSTVACDFMLAWNTVQLPTHPVPIPTCDVKKYSNVSWHKSIKIPVPVRCALQSRRFLKGLKTNGLRTRRGL
jgi:hypothetical protein